MYFSLTRTIIMNEIAFMELFILIGGGGVMFCDSVVGHHWINCAMVSEEI